MDTYMLRGLVTRTYLYLASTLSIKDSSQGVEYEETADGDEEPGHDDSDQDDRTEDV